MAIDSIAHTVTDVRFDVGNVGEVPIVVGMVADRSGAAYSRAREGLSFSSPAGGIVVSAPRVSSRIVAEISFVELSGRKRLTTGELRAGSTDWVLDALHRR